MPRINEANVRDCFSYSPPDNARAQKHDKINTATADLAVLYFQNAPESPEMTLAIRALQTARMWANAALATNGG